MKSLHTICQFNHHFVCLFVLFKNGIMIKEEEKSLHKRKKKI